MRGSGLESGQVVVLDQKVRARGRIGRDSRGDKHYELASKKCHLASEHILLSHFCSIMIKNVTVSNMLPPPPPPPRTHIHIVVLLDLSK